ncbi:NUDIX domain-containing protein, partial [Parafrankia sp. BMG5.11]|uniref:NUDIX domain-containing protein n=1 Tax=Parafrankia sp. BMG5.11 TaxID=222540 RepID=UPI00103BD955
MAPECGRWAWCYLRPGGARLVAFAEDRLLLTNRRGQTWYFLPGGNVEPDETVDTALRRETALRGDRSPGPERRVP